MKILNVHHQKQGFTLMELLVSVAIIALLASATYSFIASARMRSQIARAQSDFAQLKTALELYKSDNNSYPPGTYIPSNWSGLETDLVPYIDNIINNPLNSAGIGNLLYVNKPPSLTCGQPNQTMEYIIYFSASDQRTLNSFPPLCHNGTGTCYTDWRCTHLPPKKID